MIGINALKGNNPFNINNSDYVVEINFCKVVNVTEKNKKLISSECIMHNIRRKECVIISFLIIIQEVFIMDISYKIATIDDVDMLTELRVEVLIAANCLDKGTDMSTIKAKTYAYYKKAFLDNSHYAIIAFDKENIVGTGAVSFYNVMPTYNNPSGKKAYVMNMYTKNEYRRKGVATEVLRLLLEEAKYRNIVEITLEATKMGRVLYEKCGFIDMTSEMKYMF